MADLELYYGLEELDDANLVNADPWALAQQSGITFLSDKDFVCGHVDPDFAGGGGGVLVSALMDNYLDGKYSFDIAVHSNYRRQGLGAALIKIAVDKFNYEIKDMDPDAVLSLDVVNKDLIGHLENTYGLRVQEESGGHTIMGKTHASIIDYPRDELDPSIWNVSADQLKLQPEILTAIEDIVGSFLDDLHLPAEAIIDVFIYGSILTNQYNSKTDVDTRLLLNPEVVQSVYPGITGDKLYEITIDLIHDIKLGETEHPFNATIVIQGEQTKLGQSPLGITDRDPVYSIQQGQMVQSGELYDESFDPDQIFGQERQETIETMTRLDKLIQETKTYTVDYELIKEAVSAVRNPDRLMQKMEGKLQEINRILGELVQEYEQIKEDRDESYRNAPADDRHKAPGNVRYKMLEKYKYIDLLKKLKRIFKSGVDKEEVSDVAETLQMKDATNKRAFPYKQQGPAEVEEARPNYTKFSPLDETNTDMVPEGGMMHGGSSTCPHCGNENGMQAGEHGKDIVCASCGKKYAWTELNLSTGPSTEQYTGPYEGDVRVYNTAQMNVSDIPEITQLLKDMGISEEIVKQFEDQVKNPSSTTPQPPMSPGAPTTDNSTPTPVSPSAPSTQSTPSTQSEQGSPVEDRTIQQQFIQKPGKPMRQLNKVSSEETPLDGESAIFGVAKIGTEYKGIGVDLYAAILPEMSDQKDGKVRVQWYSSKTPIGHVVYPDAKTAAAAIIKEMGSKLLCANGSMDRFALSSSWLFAIRDVSQNKEWLARSSKTLQEARVKTAIRMLGGIKMASALINKPASLFDDGTPGKNPGDGPYSDVGKGLAEGKAEHPDRRNPMDDEEPDNDVVMEVLTVLDGMDILPFISDPELLADLLKELPLLGHPSKKVDEIIAAVAPFMPADSISIGDYPYIDSRDVAALVNELYSGGQFAGSYRLIGDEIRFDNSQDANLIRQELSSMMPSDQIPIEVQDQPYAMRPAVASEKTALNQEPAEGTGQYSTPVNPDYEETPAPTQQRLPTLEEAEEWLLEHRNPSESDLEELAIQLHMDPYDVRELMEDYAREVGIGVPLRAGGNPMDPHEHSETEITAEEAKEIGTKIGINWEEVEFSPESLAKGITVEQEHGSSDPETDVIGDDLEAAAKIAWAHLKEMADYYERLAQMEKAANEFVRRGRAFITLCPECKSMQRVDYWRDTPCQNCTYPVPGYFWTHVDEEMKKGGPREPVPKDMEEAFNRVTEVQEDSPMPQTMIAQKTNRLDPKTREKINEKLSGAGLDGNGRFDEPGQALTVAFEILDSFSIVPGEVVDAFPFTQGSGRRTIYLEFKSTHEDPMMPGVAIANSMLTMTWYKFEELEKYECLVYIS